MMAKRLCILSLIVMFAFVIAMTIVLGTTQNIAYADDIITQVELTIDTPVNGETTYWAHITDDSENRYYVRFTNWFDITADKDLTSSSDKFVGGHSYRVSITVCVMPSLYPATQFLVSGLGNPDVTAKVNNKIAATRKSYSNDAKQMFVIDYEFASTEYSQVTKVSLNGLDAPAASQNPDFDIEIAEGECHANTNMGSKNGIVWYDPMANSIVAENNTFDLGKEYETQINLEVDEGFYFGSGLEVYLNGEKLSSSNYSYINQFLTITKSYTCEKAQIKNVDITGIDAPTWESGNPKTPDYTATIGENYEFLANDEHAETGRYSGVQWWDAENGDLIENTDTFEGNKIYKARFYLKVTDPINYEFAMNGGLSAVKATVNGAVAECSPIFGYGGDYGDYLQVTYTFAPTGNTVKDIFISNFFEVEHQGHWSLGTDMLATGEAYKVHALNWYHGNQPLNECFEFGNDYYSNINIIAEDGYVFDENLTFTINGEKIDPARIERLEFEDDHKSLWAFIKFTCKETSINTVEANIMDPVTGEYVDETVTLKNTDECEGEVKWYLDANFDAEPLLETAHFANGQYGAKITLNAKDGFRFADGIKIIVNGGTYYASSADNKTFAVRIIMYSDESYTITFDANGGGAGAMEDLTFVKNGTVVNLPDCNFPAPDSDHRFVGWSESSTGSVVDNPYTFGNAADLILYAIWEEYHEYDSIEIDTSALTGATTAIVLSSNDIASGSVKVVTNGWTKIDGTPIAENEAINDGYNKWYVIKFTEDADHYMFFPEDISQETVETLVQIKGTARYFSSAIIYNSFERSITVKIKFVCYESGIRSNQINFNFFNDDKSQKITYTVPFGSTYVLPTLGTESGKVDFTINADKEFVGWLYDYGDGDITSYTPGTQIIAIVDRDFVIDLKNIYIITLNFGDKGDNIVLEVEGEMEWYVIEYFNVASALDESLLKVGDKYLVGFSESPVAEDADFVMLSETILSEQVIDKSCTLYAVYVELPDPIFDVTKPSDKILSNNGNIQELGKLTIDSYPYYYWLNEDSYYTLNVEFEGGQLVGTNDNQDKLDFEVYTLEYEDYAITIGGQRYIICSSSKDGLDNFGTIAGNKQFVYIDGYGTAADFAAVGSVVNGKIAVVNRGNNTFAEKATNADAAGAIGIIFVNNQDVRAGSSVAEYTGTIPCGMIYKSVGDLLKSGEKKISSGVEYYEGSLTISTEEEKFYFNQSYGYHNGDLFDDQDSNKNDVWVKILDPSKIKDGETYTGNVTYKFTIINASDDEVGTFTKTTKLTVGEGAPVEPSVQPDPNYPHTTVNGKEVYAQDITLATNENVGVAFASAKAGHGIVKITVDMMGLSILFDENAVNAIGGKDVILNANFITPPFNAPYTNIEGLDSVFELTLIGATFANGTATVTVHREIEVPDGKAVKVYYLNGGNRTGCTTSYQDNEITFTTNHFSSFITVIEDAQPEPQPQPGPVNPDQPAKKGLSGGAIAGIVIAIVVALGAAGFCVYWFVLRNKKGNAPKVEEKKEEEPQEEEKVEEQPEEQKTEENVEDKPTDEE